MLLSSSSSIFVSLIFCCCWSCRCRCRCRWRERCVLVSSLLFLLFLTLTLLSLRVGCCFFAGAAPNRSTGNRKADAEFVFSVSNKMDTSSQRTLPLLSRYVYYSHEYFFSEHGAPRKRSDIFVISHEHGGMNGRCDIGSRFQVSARTAGSAALENCWNFSGSGFAAVAMTTIPRRIRWCAEELVAIDRNCCLCWIGHQSPNRRQAQISGQRRAHRETRNGHTHRRNRKRRLLEHHNPNDENDTRRKNRSGE